jgi:phosphoadenosine phosphosulfate reductase
MALHSIERERAVETPEEILRDAYARFPSEKIAISFSGAEDVVLIDIAASIASDVRVFSLDTGRLHPETYRFIEQVREHYGVTIELLSPDAREVEDLVRRKGLFSFYKDGHAECCAIRKIQPLRRKLGTLDAWITGQRRDQGVTRTDVPTAQDDVVFGSAAHPVIKFNPLAGWSSADVWSYIRSRGVPYNPLHDKGFTSIGCEPCTRPVAPHDHERNGRWWWEQSALKECGLHAQNARPVRIVG